MQIVLRKIWHTLKVVAFVLLSFTIEGRANAQDSTLVSLNFKDAPADRVLAHIERQTGFAFFYSSRVKNEFGKVDINVKNMPISKALLQIFRGKNVIWYIRNRSVTLAFGDNRGIRDEGDSIRLITVKGQVLSSDFSGGNGGVAGATVKIKGGNKGAVTNESGEFIIVDVPANATLLISSIGFEPTSMKISGKTYVSITLVRLIKTIGNVEVVSTGYQNLPKERATGSFYQIGNEVLRRTPSTNILDRIQHVSSGLRADPDNQARTTGTKYVIRGFSTINSNRRPLFVIDGFPYEESAGPDVISMMNPNDIESITILKDAAAASIWGVRSGNGVIVITTKKGKINSRPEISFLSNITIEEKPRINDMPMISGADAIAYENELFKTGFYNPNDDIYPNVRHFPIISPAMELLLAGRRGELTPNEVKMGLDRFSSQDIRRDVLKYFVRLPITQQYNLSIRGGSEKSTYYLSFGYDKSKPPDRYSDSRRYTVNFSNNFNIYKFLETNFYINYGKQEVNAGNINYQNLLPGGNKVAPYSVIVDPVSGEHLDIPNSAGLRDKYLDTVNFPGKLDWKYRPLDEVNSGSRKDQNDMIRLGGEFRFKILKGLLLEFKGQYANTKVINEVLRDGSSFINRNLVNRFSFVDAGGIVQYPFPLGGTLLMSQSKQAAWNLRAQLSYSISWKEHSVVSILGAESSETKFGGSSNSFWDMMSLPDSL
ncbi:TonB-dependent receptor plug domain-containing protein [Chitinophaga pollutisoli]|uniref:TonB-dependent receptor plug domain-containing protein n=1 Tax=Chitinophaga pollutisoli TaxID=3133966 RepID=A0ABZ2YT64_9BACT